MPYQHALDEPTLEAIQTEDGALAKVAVTEAISLNDIEIPTQLEQKTESNTGTNAANILHPPIYSNGLESRLGNAASPIPEIHIYSQGHIRHLLNQAQIDAELNEFNANAEPGVPSNATCTRHHAKNMLRGTGTGLGIGWVAKAACGASVSTMLGLAGLGALFFACYNPPLLGEDLLVEDTPQPSHR